MQQRLPLIADFDPAATILWHRRSAVTQAQLLGEARALAERLPAAPCIVNLCDSRHSFIVGFLACLLSRRTSLLPSNRMQATVDELLRSFPDAALLADSDDFGANVVSPNSATVGAGWSGNCPDIEADFPAAMVFTSGSTGVPQAHVKLWHNLVSTAGFTAERLHTAGRYIVGTVPSQHMYGLETAVMTALAGRAIVCCDRPLFPEDLRRSLAGIPEPRLLITTPVHLHSFLLAGLVYPQIERIVSATAPLLTSVGVEAERQFGASIDEIYGCTEAGSIATRNLSDGELWTPYPGVSLSNREDGVTVAGPQLPAAVLLGDVIRVEADGRFQLSGRSTDMIKVAGKRASLQDLTQKLLSLPGVLDAVIFIPEPDAEISRPVALVIAPTRTEADLLRELAQQMDPVFVPRPLRKVDHLPRNDVGKLPRAALLELLKG